jgi:hypothetical protein
MEDGMKKLITKKRGTYYWLNLEDAVAVRDATVPAGRVVSYQIGHAVQLHKSGPYIGPDVDIVNHSCAWCALGS